LKVFVTLTDGAGIRNFIHSDVLRSEGGHEIVMWCNPVLAPYVTNSGYRISELPAYKSSGVIEILRSAITRAELLRNVRKFKKPDYLHYIFSKEATSWRLKIKNILVYLSGKVFSSDNGILFLRKQLRTRVEKSHYFKLAKITLQQTRPDVVLCSHQRSPEAIALVQAARALNIPTASFIFSWDNLPKGTLMVEADHYLVWSNYMKDELLQYYPWVSGQSVHVTGTPQFLPYFYKNNYMSREVFAGTFGLDASATWICFSGDDELTSPHDPLYLRDLAVAVQAQNACGKYIQIVFRPSPADISNRYDEVLSEFTTIIKKAPPQWEAPHGMNWGALIPTAKDYMFLCSLVYHCNAVFNVGSTMAIDFSILNKPSAYFKYNAKENPYWDIFKVYKFIHFDTMKGLDPVYWLNSPNEIAAQLPDILEDKENKLTDAKKWQEIIAPTPLENSKDHLWNAITSIPITA